MRHSTVFSSSVTWLLCGSCSFMRTRTQLPVPGAAPQLAFFAPPFCTATYHCTCLPAALHTLCLAYYRACLRATAPLPAGCASLRCAAHRRPVPATRTFCYAARRYAFHRNHTAATLATTTALQRRLYTTALRPFATTSALLLARCLPACSTLLPTTTPPSAARAATAYANPAAPYATTTACHSLRQRLCYHALVVYVPTIAL